MDERTSGGEDVNLSSTARAWVCTLLLSTFAVACGGSGGGADGGPGPDGSPFKSAALYAPVDEVKALRDRGVDLVLLDVRPKNDYLAEHITGALSMPFFEVKTRHGELSKARWIVTYCACPHAESELAAKTLAQNGFTRVKVLDEGIRVWKERGYPLSTGERP